MKKVKSILLSSFLLISLVLWNNLYANSNNETLTSTSEELLLIKNGNLYIQVIDNFIEKKREDTTRLEKIQSKLVIIQTKLENRNDKNSVTLKAILNYLDANITIVLMKDIGEEIIEEETIIMHDDDYKSITYPGFSESYNEYDKTILAWEEVFVYKQSYSSLYEASEVWKAIFYITGPDVSDIRSSIESASLYLEWSIIDRVWSSKIDIISSTQAKITFDSLEDFIITQNIREARLKIKTSNIGYQKIGKTISDLYVSKVWFDDIKGLSSSRILDPYSVTEPGELFSIVAGVLEVRVEKNLSSNIPEINIKAMYDRNSIDTSNGLPIIQLNTIRLSTLWSSWNSWAIYKLYNSDRSWDTVTGIVIWNEVSFDMTGMLYTNNTISNSFKWEDYKILIDWTNSNTVITLALSKKWIDYNILGISWSNNLHINMERELNLWTKNY